MSEELHSEKSFAIYADQYNQGMYLWVFLKAWEIQERCRDNLFKNDLSITGMMVQLIMMHDGGLTLKQQLTQLTKYGDNIDDLYSEIGEYHKEYVAFQKKVKVITDHVNFTKK